VVVLESVELGDAASDGHDDIAVVVAELRAVYEAVGGLIVAGVLPRTRPIGRCAAVCSPASPTAAAAPCLCSRPSAAGSPGYPANRRLSSGRKSTPPRFRCVRPRC
jgi:hypothetical protein